jgi:hypothetical protein
MFANDDALKRDPAMLEKFHWLIRLFEKGGRTLCLLQTAADGCWMVGWGQSGPPPFSSGIVLVRGLGHASAINEPAGGDRGGCSQGQFSFNTRKMRKMGQPELTLF